MKRKIVKQGKATMTISLPAPWIKTHNLKEGDELNIEEQGNNINLSTEKSKGTKSIELSDTDMGSFRKGDLSHLYIVGYDEIILHYKNSETVKNIQERIPDCIGYEIIDQTEKIITIRTISSELEQEFDNILNKVFLQLKQMSQDICAALKNKEFDRLKKIRELEKLNNKFTSFLLRLLTKRGYKKQDRTPQAYDLIQNLERLADEYKYLCDGIKKGIKDEQLEMLEQVSEYFDIIYHLYLKFDPVKKIALEKLKLELDIKSKKMLKNSEIAHYILNLVEKARNVSGSYLALSS